MKATVLLVDDEDEIRASIEELIGEEYSCLHARNGHEAIYTLSQLSVDVIITDYNMPDLDGMELVKILNERKKQTPVIVLTGRGSIELNRRTLAFSVYEYLEKPFHPQLLRNTLQACLKTGALSKEEIEAKEDNIFSKAYYRDLNLKLSKDSYSFIESYCLNQGISIGTYFETHIAKLRGSK